MAPEAAPAPAPPSRALRIWYCVVQTIALLVLVYLSFIARKFEEIFIQLEMKGLPLPSEFCIAVARFVRHPAVVVLLAVAAVALVVLALRGALDRRLRRLITANVVATGVLVGFYVLSLFLPILRIQHELEKQQG